MNINYKSCYICIKQSEELIPLNLKDKNSVNFAVKLVYILPEYDWPETLFICSPCSQQLEIAYNFKKLCLANYEERQSLFNSTIESESASNEPVFENKVDLNVVKKEYKEITNNKKIIAELEPFTCYQCDKSFKSKTLLKRHIRNHETNQSGKKQKLKFQCDICKESFTLLKQILHHCLTIHAMCRKDIKPYCCTECSNKFASQTLLIQHRKYHNGERTFICTICGKSFITSRDLNCHEKLHYNERSYGCDKCSKTFNTSQNLKTHIYVVHTDSSQWKYSCPVCTKRFPMKANWKEHIRRHEGNKNFICHICKKPFVSNHELKRHVSLHSNIAQHQCSECEKNYRDKRSLDLHLSKVHGIGTVTQTLRVKKFFCHICPSQFFDNPKLQRHLRTHTGVKPFSCTECDKKFIDKCYLNCHKKNAHS